MTPLAAAILAASHLRIVRDAALAATSAGASLDPDAIWSPSDSSALAAVETAIRLAQGERLLFPDEVR
jgi:cyanophycinase-like exopeptidase